MADEPYSHPIRPSFVFERALRMAASGHRDQVRKGSNTPYIEHPVAVAMILERSGFDEEVVISGLLHDVVEDTHVTLDEVRRSFGDRVADIVAGCSEEKVDADGQKRPWSDRKSDHIEAVKQANDEVRSVVLADKLHNLLSIQLDLLDGHPVWSTFSADRLNVLNYYEAMLSACVSREPRLARLLVECRILLGEIIEFER